MKKTSQTLAALLASAAACFAAPPQATTPAPAELAWPSEIPADCPIPKSATFGGILFTGRHAEYTNADTWYPSWAADGKLYSPYTDGNRQARRVSNSPR